MKLSSWGVELSLPSVNTCHLTTFAPKGHFLGSKTTMSHIGTHRECLSVIKSYYTYNSTLINELEAQLLGPRTITDRQNESSHLHYLPMRNYSEPEHTVSQAKVDGAMNIRPTHCCDDDIWLDSNSLVSSPCPNVHAPVMIKHDQLKSEPFDGQTHESPPYNVFHPGNHSHYISNLSYTTCQPIYSNQTGE